MGSGVAVVPAGVEVWMGAPTNVMLRGSGSWVGWGCSVETGTLQVAAGPLPAEGWGPEGHPRSGSASRTLGGSDSTRLLMGLARRF